MDCTQNCNMTLTLIEVCCRTIADSLLMGSIPAKFPEDVPQIELLLRIYNLYTTRSAAGPRDYTTLLRHLLVLQAFAEDWQLRQLRLSSLPACRPRALTQLHLVSSCLTHLELLDADWLQDLTWLLHAPPPLPTPNPGRAAAPPTSPASWPPHQHRQHQTYHQHAPYSHPHSQSCVWSYPQHPPRPNQPAPGAAQLGQQTAPVSPPVAPPQLQLQPLQLTCLVLRGCRQLPPSALAPLQALAPRLVVLDLSGAEQLDDSAAGLLSSLGALQVLNLSNTAVGDVTLAALTYGARVRAWARQYGTQPQTDTHMWPELDIRRWHLAGTRVTAAGVALLVGSPQLHFLDVRGAGVPRAALRPLEVRFQLVLVQGAVLATSNSLAAALVNHPERLACACSAGDMAALGPATSGTMGARARPRRQVQRVAQQRVDDIRVTALEGNGSGSGAGGRVGRRGVGLGDSPLGQAGASGAGGVGSMGLAGGSAVMAADASGVVAAADEWQQQWATCGVAEMVATCEAVLQVEEGSRRMVV